MNNSPKSRVVFYDLKLLNQFVKNEITIGTLLDKIISFNESPNIPVAKNPMAKNMILKNKITTE